MGKFVGRQSFRKEEEAFYLNMLCFELCETWTSTSRCFSVLVRERRHCAGVQVRMGWSPRTQHAVIIIMLNKERIEVSPGFGNTEILGKFADSKDGVSGRK